MADCDNGWVHICGGPHAVEDGDSREVVPVRAPEDGGCVTDPCPNHCCCFAPDGAHVAPCSQIGA